MHVVIAIKIPRGCPLGALGQCLTCPPDAAGKKPGMPPAAACLLSSARLVQPQAHLGTTRPGAPGHCLTCPPDTAGSDLGMFPAAAYILCQLQA